MGAHGTSDDRITAFFEGYLNGFIGCDLPLSGGLSGGKTAGGGGSSSSRPSSVDDDLTELLPQERDVPADLGVTAERLRSLSRVTENYTDPAETEELFTEWGWDGNATRTFQGDGGNSGITYVYVSIHRFGTPSGASRALDYSLEDQMASTDAREVDIAPVGDRVRALSTVSSGGDETTVYTQQGDVLIRVTVVSVEGDSAQEVLNIARTCVQKAK